MGGDRLVLGGCLLFLLAVLSAGTGFRAVKAGFEGHFLAQGGREVRDELTVVFSPGRPELDFRLSFLINEAQLFTALYEGLFSYNPVTTSPIPALAESWELSDDGRQWTFTIRENARFSNGDRIVAEDFRRSWLSLLAPERQAPYSGLFDIIEGAKEYRSGETADADSVGIVANGRTLTVRLRHPAAFFPSMLCHHSFSPIHKSMVNVGDWWTTKHVGNGPFRIGELGEDRMILRANSQYWDAGSVGLNALVIRFADEDTASELWNSGQARWVSGGVNLETLTDRSGISVHTLFGTHFYFIRSAEPPFDDYRVRRALALALPWEELRAGHFLPAKTLIFPLQGYPEIDGLGDTDPAEAARLLAEAGFPGGKGLPELVFRIPSADAADTVALMADAWKEHLGVSSRVEVVPFADYFDALAMGGYHVGSMSWIGDFPDPYSFLKMWQADSNLNTAGLRDADFDRLMERSMSEEGTKRWETMAEAEQLLLYRGSVLPISFTPAINIIDTNELDGWFPNALGIHPFKYFIFRELTPLPNVVMAVGGTN
ncbi:MAG: peptide ABC transporter substrate-binding protein [Treponema sp.]|nr:peptide ABC transporter substrate-binding protein [Treponema sp.]